jgi:two-component system phosphate regulon sensor histidine kinase PhoR
VSTGLIPLNSAFEVRETEARLRSVWIWQLSFSAVVAIIVVFTALVDPSLLRARELVSGLFGVFLTTIAALVLPWQRWPPAAAAVLPYLAIVWVGLLTFGTDYRLSHLWVFPITWLAALFPLRHFAIGLGGVALVGFIEVLASAAAPTSIARVLIALLALGFVGVTVHVTARQALAYRTLLRRQAERLRHTLNTVSIEQRRVSDTLDDVHIAIARISPTGEVLSSNSAYRELYALDDADPQQPAHSVEYDALRGSALREGRRTLARAARGETLEGERVWLFDPEGRWHALSVTTRRQEPRPGEEPAILLIAQDISEAIAADRRRNALAAVVSHELRNPLTAILGHADRILERPDLDSDLRERLLVIEESGERMMQLISTILAAPPVEAARVDRDGRAVTDLRGILEASVESFAGSAREREVELHLVPGDALQLWGDAFRLRQLVDNLIGNAVKYTSGRGIVTVSAHREGADVEIVIADTGIGIPAEDKARVFEQYFRSPLAVDSGIPGTGIGLGIVADIVAAHDGAIDIESEPGVGTVVTVRIPVEA